MFNVNLDFLVIKVRFGLRFKISTTFEDCYVISLRAIAKSSYFDIAEMNSRIRSKTRATSCCMIGKFGLMCGNNYVTNMLVDCMLKIA